MTQVTCALRWDAVLMTAKHKKSPGCRRGRRQGSDGITINFFWPDARFGVQIDYPDFTPKERLLNRINDDQLRSEGVEILRVRAEDIEQRPDWLMRQLREALERRTPAPDDAY